MKRHRAIVGAASVLLLFTLACGSCPTATPFPTLVPQSGDASPAPTLPPTTSIPASTYTPIPTATHTPIPNPTEGACAYGVDFVSDVTIPDNTVLSPGASFVKTWRLKNSGTCTWETGSKLVFISGEQMGGPPEAGVGPVAPGAEVDISVNLVAPTTPGTHKGNWQMEDHEGVRFGSAFHVQIVVPGPATTAPNPTAQPTASNCVAIDAQLHPIHEQASTQGYELGCATEAAFYVNVGGHRGALQEFWNNVDDPNPHVHYRSLMIWRADTRDIYVIVGEDTDASKGTILAYTDFWEESQPTVHPDCATMAVPAGYELPVRGFGKVWCENELWNQIGWPAQPEAAADLLVQSTEYGVMLKATSSLRNYLVAMHFQAVRAVTRMVAP